MLECIRGQKAKVSDLAGSLRLEVGLDVVTGGPAAPDVSLFGLDPEGKLSDDRYLIFYNQKTSPEGALALVGPRHGDREVFEVDLARLPGHIKRLVFTVSIDTGRMGDLKPSHLRLMVAGDPVARFACSGSDFGEEKALILAELYFKDVWRFAAIGQGFTGGLSALLAHFGGQEIAPAPAPAAAPAPPPPPPPPATRPSPPPATAPIVAADPPRVSLTKVTLDKSGAKQAVSLKKGGGLQPIHVNLNWDNPNASKRTGFLGLGGKAAAPDLDLGCMFRMTDGSRGVVQSLGNSFGSRHAPPYLYLDKDDRSGAASDGENLYITRPDLIDTVLVFALIYQGAAGFAQVNGRLTIRDQEGREIFIPLNNPDSRHTFCAICRIDRRGDRIEITKEERYYTDHAAADKQYGFGFRWTAGSK